MAGLLEVGSLADAVGGAWVRRPEGSAPLEGVGIDSRQDLAGRVFFAIKGERHDGHDHVAEAARRGARAVVVHRGVRVPRVPVVRVDDTRLALGRLAAWWRRRLRSTRVVCVTGSVGKTTTKSLIDRVLGGSMPGRCAERSFNNDIGLPLSLLEARTGDRYLVLEIGANNPGEIDALAAIAKPDIGVVTAVGRAHLAGFGGLASVAREKASMLRHLNGHGLAVVNADAPLLDGHLGGLREVVSYGASAGCDLQLTDRGAEGEGWYLEVNGSRRFGLGLPGRHNALNALAAVAVGRRLGVSDEAIDRALAAARPVEMRMASRAVAGMTVYNDAYNANPDSVMAALETFAELAAGAARRVVILGDMRELGAETETLHRQVGLRLVEMKGPGAPDLVVLVGESAEACAGPLREAWDPARFTVLADGDGFPRAAAAWLKPGDAVLLKASRALALERVIDELASA